MTICIDKIDFNVVCFWYATKVTSGVICWFMMPSVLGGSKNQTKEMNKMIKVFLLHQNEENIHIDLSTQVCQISSIRGPASVIKQKKQMKSHSVLQS